MHLPFLDGKYSVAPGLIPIHKLGGIDAKIFQIDEFYASYRKNKDNCRAEDISKYVLHSEFNATTIAAVNTLILKILAEEYPTILTFQYLVNTTIMTNQLTGEEITWDLNLILTGTSRYQSLFDALCSQLQEDFAVCQLSEDKDWLAAIHLCAPNHWSPAEKIGKPFDLVHAPVPGIERTLHNYQKMLQSVVEKGPYVRFAWGVATDARLNHHPEAPPSTDNIAWSGRAAGAGRKELYLRVERQNLIGIPEANAFLFTIRTYFYNVAALSIEQTIALRMALKSMSPEQLTYKGIPADYQL